MIYNAFISYKHAEKDIFVAKQVHKRLETFKIPRAVKKSTGKKKIERVFRDVEELPIGSDLGNNISTALEESEYLIVICSKETPKSYWVNQEIETFIKLKGHNKILAVLVDGEPEEAFPPKLLTDDYGNPIEPLAADVRGKSLKEINKKMKTEIVRLAAQVIGCSYDELKQRHRERRMRKIITASVAIAVMAISFGIYSVYNYLTIKKNYEAKLINQSKYLADTSITLLEHGDRMTAGLIALEALPGEGNKRPLVSSAQLALSQALYAYADGNDMLKDRLLKHDLSVEDIKYSDDGSKLVSLDLGGNVYVWDVSNGNLLLKVAPSEEIMGTMLTTEDELVIVGSNTIKCMDLEGEVLWSEETSEGYIASVFDTTNNKVACISNEFVEIYDATNGEIIAEIKNTDEDYSFSKEATFDSEGENFVIAGYIDSEDVEDGRVYTVNLSNSKTKSITTNGNNIIELCYTMDGDILVMSRNGNEYSSVENLDISVERFSKTSQKLLWENTVSISTYELQVSNVILKARSYSDGNDNYDEVIVAFNNTLYVWDGEDGADISYIIVPEGIASVLYSTQSSIGYIVNDNGVLDFYDFRTGQLASTNQINIDRSATQVIIKNGVLAAKIYSSSDVLLMKYYEGHGMEVIQEFDDFVYELEYSETEEVYVVIGGDSSYDNALNFYDSKTDELIFQYKADELYDAYEYCFVGDDNFYVFLNTGIVLVVDVNNDSVEYLEVIPDDNSYEWVVTSNNKYAVAYSHNFYAVIDLENQKVITDGSTQDYLYSVNLSLDGADLYLIFENKTIKANTDNGNETTLDVANFNAVSVSSDKKYLAGICKDNKIRVYETEKWEVVNEIDFIGRNICFIEFVADEYVFIAQGDSNYWGAFDIESNEYIYLSDNQYNPIAKVISKDDTVAIYSDIYMLILNKEDYEPIADVTNGIGYLPETGVVYTKNMNVLYKFPYMDLDMLLEQAKEEFGNYTLSKLERIQYNID